jgi:hypothetical protein
MSFSNPIDGQFLPLASDLSSTALTFDVVGRFTKTSTVESGLGTQYQVGTQVICFSLGEPQASQERAIIRVTSNPTLIDAAKGIYRYTIVTGERGLDSDNQTDVSASIRSQTSNQKAHAAGKLVGIVTSSAYNTQVRTEFTSATTSESKTSGEAFAANIQLSLHTDGKYYKYHSTNYPNWAGTSLSATAGANEAFTLAKAGYKVGGFVGLTIGARQYAENTGATTETPSATTYYIGKAESATEIRLEASSPAVGEATEVQARAGTVQSVYMSPLRTYQAIQEGEMTYAADAGANDTYVITLTPAPTAYTTGMEIKFKANTINTGACTLNVNSLGAKDIRKNGTTVLTDGDIAAGQIVTVVYDGTQFQLQTPSSAIPTPSTIALNTDALYKIKTGSRLSAYGGSATGSADVTSYGTVDKDLLSNFNPTTGIFTCPEAGDYLISFGARLTGADVTVDLYKNAGSVHSLANNTDPPISVSATRILVLALNDTIKMATTGNAGNGFLVIQRLP